MPSRDILITPRPTGSTINPSIDFANWSGDTIKLEVLVDGTISFIGSNGQLFTIADSLTGSLMSVNNISGLPIFEVFSHDKIVGGAYNTNAFVISGSTVGIGTEYPGDYNLYVSGITNIDGSFYLHQGQEINEIVTSINALSTDYQLPTAESVYELVTEYVVASGGTGGSSTFLGLTDVSIGSFTDTRILFEGSSSVEDFSGFTYDAGNLLTVEGSLEQGLLNSATGEHAHAEGTETVASGDYSHAQGYKSIASGNYSHAEGAVFIISAVEASGEASHAEGAGTTSSGIYSHAEGIGNKSEGLGSHAEGVSTTVTSDGIYSHSEGGATTSSGIYSHSEGFVTTTSGVSTHAEGFLTYANGYASHAEGSGSTATGDASHAEGFSTTSSGFASHSIGQQTIASGNYSYAEGSYTIASGEASHAEGSGTTASGLASHAEGKYSTAEGIHSHVEGFYSKAVGAFSHAESLGIANGTSSHAEGYSFANGDYSHTGGFNTVSQGDYSFSHGTVTESLANLSVAFGSNAIASGITSFSLGYYTHSVGFNQTVIGHYNIENGVNTTAIPALLDKSEYGFILGNGLNDSNRSNAFAIDWMGNTFISSGLTLGTNSNYVDEIVTTINDSSTDSQLPTAAAVWAVVPDVPSYFVTNQTEFKNAMQDINDNYNGGNITINGTVNLTSDIAYDFSGVRIFGNGKGYIDVWQSGNNYYEIHITGSTTFEGVIFRGSDGGEDRDFRSSTGGTYHTRTFIKVQDPTASLTFIDCAFADIVSGYQSWYAQWVPVIEYVNQIPSWYGPFVRFRNCRFSSHRADNDNYISYEGFGIELVDGIDTNAGFNIVVEDQTPTSNAYSGTSNAYFFVSSNGKIKFTSDESAWVVHYGSPSYERNNSISQLIKDTSISLTDELMFNDVSTGNIKSILYAYLTGGTGGGGGGVTEFINLTDTPGSYNANRVFFTNSAGNAVTDSSDLTYNEGTANLNVFEGVISVTAGHSKDPYFALTGQTNGVAWNMGLSNVALSTSGYFYITDDMSSPINSPFRLIKGTGVAVFKSGITLNTGLFANEITDTVDVSSTDEQIPSAKAVWEALPGGGGGGESEPTLICVEDETELNDAFTYLNNRSGGTIQITPTASNPYIQLTKNITVDMTKIILKGGAIRFGSYSGGYSGYKMTIHNQSSDTSQAIFENVSFQGTASDSGYDLSDPTVHFLIMSGVTKTKFENCSFSQLVSQQTNLYAPIPNIEFYSCPDWASVHFDNCQFSTVNASNKEYMGFTLVLTGYTGDELNHFYIIVNGQKIDSHTIAGTDDGPYKYAVAGLAPLSQARFITDGTATLEDNVDEARGVFASESNPEVNEINRWLEISEDDLADSKLVLSNNIGKLYNIDVTSFFFSGGTGGGSVTAPEPLEGLDATEQDDYIIIEITGSTTSDTDTLEIWASQEASDSGFNKIAQVDKNSLDDYMVIYDDSYTRKSQIWYRGYAIKTGKYSTVVTKTITPVNEVTGVTNMQVVSENDKIFLEFDVPNDRRLEEITIRHDSSQNPGALSYGSSSVVYSGGIRDNYIYEIPNEELGDYHQFWVETITRT